MSWCSHLNDEDTDNDNDNDNDIDNDNDKEANLNDLNPVEPTTMLCAKPWTIESLLLEARRLHKVVTPLFTWSDLQEVIQSLRLDLLRRHPSIEVLYTTCFNPLIKQEYGSTEAYLRMQLGWTQQSIEMTTQDWWTRHDQVIVRRNDWSYSVPRDVEHFVCWTRKPLFHVDLCKPCQPLEQNQLNWDQFDRSNIQSMTPNELTLLTPPGTPTKERNQDQDLETNMLSLKDTWPFVLKFGLSGQTGSKPNQFTKETEEIGPGCEINAFVKQYWSEDEWETLWFANPPSLQSVRGLAHFHVLVRRRGPATSWEERDE
ncbi:hypothetical protein OIO90_002587 [Microbotryomycetes sp. JL221]|nr:hypothetical protein OIO90_002587 [Microbotryomycetes sp. JL221]